MPPVLMRASTCRNTSPSLGDVSMSRTSNPFAQPYLETLLAGDRAACRKVIDSALASGLTAQDLITGLVWQTMELLQSLYREDRISIAGLNLATRLNRTVTDQLCGTLERAASKDKKVLIFCGDDEP